MPKNPGMSEAEYDEWLSGFTNPGPKSEEKSAEMSDNEPASEPEGVRAIRHLVRLMKRYDLTAIDFVEGPTQIRLRRRGPEARGASLEAASTTASAPVHAPSPTLTSPPAAPQQPPAPSAPSGIMILSPMVGTFYSSSSPDAAPFVGVGSMVRPDTTVCLIEAMKMFTDIPSGVAGTIAEVLVKSGEAVEFDQPLFRVVPA